MSLRLRFKYQMRSMARWWLARQLPGWIKSSALRTMVVFSIIVVGAGYLFVTNSLATSGFAIQRLEERLAELESETRRLESEVAEFQSLQNVEDRLNEVSLTEPVARYYFTVSGGAVVAKR